MTLCILKVLIRRSQIPDELPGDYKIDAGQDIMISVYNIHHSSKVLLDQCSYVKKGFFYGPNAASWFECSIPVSFF